MDLTETERKWFLKLRRRHQHWSRTRWVVLIGGIIGIAGGTYNYLNLIDRFSEPTVENAMLWAYLLPECYLVLISGAAMLTVAITRWKGHAGTRLLIRLIEAEVEKSRLPGDT